MDPITLTIIISLALVVGAFALIFYPLWQQTRPDAIFRVDRSGQTLEEYQARYQATLASIKDLMFDYEMGKVSTEDYETLLQSTKLEAAQLRQQIDRLSQGVQSVIDADLDHEIEMLVSQLRKSQPNGNKALLQEINAEIESLKHMTPHTVVGGPACPNCGKAFKLDDAFCTGCGQALPELAPAAIEAGCPECGTPIKPDDAFCAKCGTALTENVTA